MNHERHRNTGRQASDGFVRRAIPDAADLPRAALSVMGLAFLFGLVTGVLGTLGAMFVAGFLQAARRWVETFDKW